MSNLESALRDKWNELDETMCYLEDVLHGDAGAAITKARKLLSSLLKAQEQRHEENLESCLNDILNKLLTGKKFNPNSNGIAEHVTEYLKNRTTN